MSAVNESLIRDVVAEVLSRLGGAPAAAKPASSEPAASSCGCGGKGAATSAPGLRGKFGVFQDANEASAAAHESFVQLQKAGVAARVKIVEIVKAQWVKDENADCYGKPISLMAKWMPRENRNKYLAGLLAGRLFPSATGSNQYSSQMRKARIYSNCECSMSNNGESLFNRKCRRNECAWYFLSKTLADDSFRGITPG